jgi:hypothetical protein
VREDVFVSGVSRRGRARVFLGVRERPPHLAARILPQDRARHVPARADQADAAFSHLWIREDWLALRSHQQLWALPIPLADKARLLAQTWDTLPREDGRKMWVQHPDGSSWITIDGNGSRDERLIPRRTHERLEAIYGGNALVRDGHGQALRLRCGCGDDLGCGAGHAVCQAGPLAVIRSELGAGLDLLDLRDGQRRRIQRPGLGCWGHFASVSPDGTLIAISGELRAAPASCPAGMPMTEWRRHPAAQRSRDDRNVMAIISLPAADATIIGKPFRNFATAPAWTSTGDALTFSIPFECQLAWADLSRTTLTRLGASTDSFVPLTDATALLGEGIHDTS